MSSPSKRHGFRGVIAAAGLSLVATPLTLLPSTAHAAEVDITLLNINDFHGRIDSNTMAFAATVEGEKTANSLFLSAGDNIGASLFASAVAEDNPTLDVLDALGLKASAVGNHEFDKGFDDLTGHVDQRADFTYLGANVYTAGTEDPVLPEYATFDVGGLTVGVIGAVTQEVPTLVTPGGIEGLEFGDPVEAVNRVAGELSDGNADNGEADVIVAEYHAGATQGGESTPTDVSGLGAEFQNIWNNTSAEVDAIFTGHTHMQYAWDAPIPGSTETRPIVQTGSYGANVGKITLTVDDVTGEVTAYTAENVPQLAPEEDADGEVSEEAQAAFDKKLADMIAASPTLQNVKEIVDAALDFAEEEGKVKVGEVTDDITTAFAEGHFENGVWVGPGPEPADGRDDRTSESTLGNLVANALRDSLSADQYGNAEIGVVNPGGLRSELFFEGTGNPDTDQDGVVTFAEANSVLPFVNNLWTVTLTGAEFKQILEEQWQPDGADRPFLHLGLSDNVSTVLDESKPRGERVVSVRVNGEPLKMKKEYKIATFSFLAQGGDNFTTFAGQPFQDSGLIDRDAWIKYLGDNAPVSPSFELRQVFTDGLPTNVHPGRNAFTLEKLNLTSLGSPKNTRVNARLVPLGKNGKAIRLGRFAVNDEGTAHIKVRIPATGRTHYALRLVAKPSGTTVTLPVVSSKVRPHLRVVVKPDRIRDDVTHPRVRVKVRSGGHAVHGKVRVRTHGDVMTLRLHDGKAVARFAPYHTHGKRMVRVRYLGNKNFSRVMETVRFRVHR